MKLVFMLIFVYAVNTNRIGYVSDAGASGVGEDEWFEPGDDEGSFSGGGGVSEKMEDVKNNSEDNSMLFENDNIKRDDMKKTHNVNNSMLKQDYVKTPMKPVVSTKSYLGETEKILRSVSMEAWFILGFFGVIVISIMVMFCCLLSIKWRMRLMAKQMKHKDELMIIKKRLSIVEKKEENTVETKEEKTPFQRSSNLPITSSVRRMSGHNKKSKRTVSVNDGEENAKIKIFADVVIPPSDLPVDTDDHVIHGDDSSVPPASPDVPPEGPNFNGDEDDFKDFE